jgi:hypothetical protein
MELHARPDVSALDRLNTPPTGAHAIPMSALAGLNLEEEGTGTPVCGCVCVCVVCLCRQREYLGTCMLTRIRPAI